MTAQATVHELRSGAIPAIAQPPAHLSVGFDTLAGFELTQRVAKMFASSSLMPKDFQGNVANCAIALNMAARIGADPLMVAQNLYIVHGRPAWSAQFMIATFNACGRFSAIRYEYDGAVNADEWKCRAWATEKATGDRLEGAWVSIGLSKKEGWYQKNGSKWQSMPQQMLQYRAASWFVRTHAPEIAMGIQSVDEVRDTWDLVEETPGTYAVTTAEIIQQDAKQVQETVEQQPAPEQPPKRTVPTREEMQAKRDTVKAELVAAGVFEAVSKAMGDKGRGTVATWNSLQCQQALYLGKEMASAQQQEQPQDVPAPNFITCPNAWDAEQQNNLTIDRAECAGCPERPGCAAWATN